ncbi:hypothetical protein HA402_008110 [Bradysia odoriphaga]|nr:hypothetical protein HA402_008110 [Bradysia odoriphaga]
MIFLLRGLLIIAISIQLVAAEETHSTVEFTTCLTQSQLALVEDAVIKASLTKLEEDNLAYLWNFLTKMNPGGKQITEKIIKQGLQKIEHCFEREFVTLLKFVNQLEDKNAKLAGYQTLFREMAFNSTTNQSIKPFLNLHHYISQDESINTDADFEPLLNSIESTISDFLKSTQNLFSSSGNYCRQPIINTDYLIKQIISSYPDKIEKLWNELSGGYSTELLLQFMSELEKNNRMNYTLMFIPRIKSEFSSPIFDKKNFNKTCNLRRQLHAKIQTFPKNSPSRKLLSHDQFYIKNAYDQQYVHMTENSNVFLVHVERTQVYTSSDRNAIWKFDFANNHDPKDAVEIYDGGRRIIDAKKCGDHDEWYATGNLYQFYNAHGTWILKMAQNDTIRIQNKGTGLYLRIGSKNFVIVSELDESEINKFEWIIENDEIEDRFDKEYECKDSW